MKSLQHGKRLHAAADIDTPIGPMTALTTDKGLAALWFDARQRYAADLVDVPNAPEHPVLAATRRWLAAYWGGADASAIDVPLDLHGTPFQRAVWAQLQRIPQGQTRSYGEVAAAIGGRGLARACGAACGANPVGVIVPCHRVLGTQGALTGYAGGLKRKQQLLRQEGLLLTGAGKVR